MCSCSKPCTFSCGHTLSSNACSRPQAGVHACPFLRCKASLAKPGAEAKLCAVLMLAIAAVLFLGFHAQDAAAGAFVAAGLFAVGGELSMAVHALARELAPKDRSCGAASSAECAPGSHVQD
jgi:hypothetical protein